MPERRPPKHRYQHRQSCSRARPPMVGGTSTAARPVCLQSRPDVLVVIELFASSRTVEEHILGARRTGAAWWTAPRPPCLPPSSDAGARGSPGDFVFNHRHEHSRPVKTEVLLLCRSCAECARPAQPSRMLMISVQPSEDERAFPSPAEGQPIPGTPPAEHASHVTWRSCTARSSKTQAASAASNTDERTE